MPDEWKITLQNSTITPKDCVDHPEAVIRALDFYHHHQKHVNSFSKYMQTYPSDKSKHFFNQNSIIYNT